MKKNLGAGTFSNILFNYFVQEIKKKHKLDVTTNSKASFRLLAACERLKKNFKCKFCWSITC